MPYEKLEKKERRKTKRPYVSPTLEEYGDIADLTKGAGGNTADIFAGSYVGK